MSVNVSWTITCDAWLEKDNDGCAWSCDANNEGDGFFPDEADWIVIEFGNEEDGGEYYCPACVKRKGLDYDA